ncbi:MAG: formimidoylglutamate deiminase, partial [Pseudorhodobacter sp.]|nr:formimidoylglutamate deiminase [Pseudorhodobacter sp.]
RGGSQAAGRDAGVIATGKLADLVALHGDGPDMAGRKGDLVLDAYIFAGDDRLISDLWSAGRHLVTDGQHHAHDAISRAYVATITKLRSL